MYDKVMACLDHSSYAHGVSDYASWAAKRLSVALEFVHVLEHHQETAHKLDLSGNIGVGSQESLLAELALLDEKRASIALERGRLLLEAAKRRAYDSGVADPQIRQRHGELVETLAELEAEVGLFVLGKRGEAGDRAPEHLGANLERVVRALHRPILVAPIAFKMPQRIMVAYDGGMTARKGVEMLAASTLISGLECRVVYVASDSPSSHSQLAWAEQTLSGGGVQVSTAIIDGEPEKALPAYAAANDIDLVVMGAYGHSRIRQLLVGSTTTSIIRTSNLPVLLLR